MVRAGALLLLVLPVTAGAEEVNLAEWAAALPEHYTVQGVKNEPTYLAATDVIREGDLITIKGGAPAWTKRSMEALRVYPDGQVAQVICPPGMMCTQQMRSAADGTMPAGFLSTAGLISAQRQGRLTGRAEMRPFGKVQVICLPGEVVGIADPILDPCFETVTGAAIAQRHRDTGAFDGPTLDPADLTITLGAVPGGAAGKGPGAVPQDKN